MPGFTYLQKQTKNTKIQRNKRFTIYLSKQTYFQHEMFYGSFKDLTRRTASDKVLRDKAFNIAKNTKYDRYQRGLDSVVCKFFDRKTSGGCIKTENISNREIAKELHKPIIRKFKKRKVYPSFKDNICGDNLAHMQSIN